MASKELLKIDLPRVARVKDLIEQRKYNIASCVDKQSIDRSSEGAQQMCCSSSHPSEERSTPDRYVIFSRSCPVDAEGKRALRLSTSTIVLADIVKGSHVLTIDGYSWLKGLSNAALFNSSLCSISMAIASLSRIALMVSE